jgi:GT2 family glycosyltransferase
VSLTVSIVNHNGRETLLPLLAALADEDVVVLDNASEDGSVAAVRERFPDVRVIEQPYRAGFGANHNRVIRETEADYVVLLSHDAEPEPGAVDALRDFAEAHPRAAVVAPRLRFPDGRDQVSAWRFPSPGVAALSTLTLARAGVVQSKGDTPRRVDWAMGAALLLRRAALDEVGLFDEGYFMYSEETDLCLRLAEAGWERWFMPQAVVVHHDSAMRDQVPRERIAEEWRSRRRYWREHHSAAGVRVAEAATGLQYAARAGIASVLRRRYGAGFAARMRLHARSAWRGPQGPGLRELADQWNGEHPAGSARDSSHMD